MGDPLTFVVTLALRVGALLFLLRFVLQAVHASFYNPFSEGIVRFTNPVLEPMRKLLRPYRNLDFASFVMAWVMHMLAAVVFIWAAGLSLDVFAILTDGLRATLSLVVGIFMVAILVSIIMSWIAPQVYSPAAIIARELAEPLLAPARRILPPLGGIDLSPMITIVALMLIQSYAINAVLPCQLWCG
ncbi:MAG: YggT family protein [Gammaproteobacteria bacterium]|nr:YggT family protein [Gammaproteobacteria bacterium]